MLPNHAMALFSDRHAAHAAVEQLVQAGFARDAISVVMSERAHEREYGDDHAGADRSGVRPTHHAGVLGAIVATLVAFARPGALPLRAAGPLAAALVRSGRTREALRMALASAGIGTEAARFVERGLRKGDIAVDVQTNQERATLAQRLLELSGGEARRAA